MATSSQQPSTRSKLKTTFGSLRHRPSPAPVPSGTVASRVSYLQSLAASATNRASSTYRSPSSPKARNTVRSKRPPNDDFRVDDDRGGLGSRTSPTFGYPAQRNNDTHEDPPEEKKHMIMGWQIKRAKNDSDNKSINSIKSGSDKKGFREKVKDVFGHSDRSAPASPEIIYANQRTVSISVRDRGKDHGVPERKGQLTYPPSSTVRATSATRRGTVVRAPPQPGALAKVASRDFAEEALISGHKVHNWLAGHGSGSEASNGQSVATTSTGRVRSVQQMYTSYGIPEPSELFSKPLPLSRAVGGDPRMCHVCKWVNVGVERCSCCGHRLCGDCAVEPTVAKPKRATETAEIAQLLLEDEYSEEDDSTHSRYSISQVARRTSIEFKEEVFGKTATDRKRSSRHSPMTLKKPPVHKVGIFEERFDLPARDPSIALARAYTTGDGASPPNRHSLAEQQAGAEDITKLYQPLREQREELTRSPQIPPEVILEYARTLSPPRVVAPEIAKAHKKSMVKDSPFLKADKNAVRKPTPKLKRVAHKGAQHVHVATGKAKAVKAAHRVVASSAAAKDVTPKASKAPPLHPSRHVAALSATLKALSSQAPTKIETVRQDDEMSSVKCDSPTCRATHDGYRPYRHSISCSKKKIIESVSSTPTSPKDVMSPLLMSPLMPKPLSPAKRRTEDVKIDEVLAQPAAVPVKNDKPVNENVADKTKKLSAESARLSGQSSPYSKAVVAVLAKPAELISPLGSDGHEDGTPAPPKTTQPPAPSSGSTRKKGDCAEHSSNGSDFAAITSTGQITTIYETSITEHPLHHKNKRHNQQRPAHRRGKYTGPTRPSRSSAERSHEELVKRKHQALSSHSTTALGFCPPIPHIHRIERSTEYIECYPEAGIPQDRARKSSITYHNMDSQNNQPPRTSTRPNREVKHHNTCSRQSQSDKKPPQADRQEQDLEDWDNERQGVTETSHHNVTREDSIDRGTFVTTRTKRGQDQQKSASEAASACVPRISDSRPAATTTQDALNNEELAQMEADHNSAGQGHSAQNFLKQVGNTVKRQGKTVLGYDPLERIVKPRIGLQERKRRAKYGDMDPALASSNQDSDFDTMVQQRHASSGSSTDESILQLQPIVASDASDEPGPSSRTRYVDRRQKRPEGKDLDVVHYRKNGVMHSRKMDSGDSFEHLTTQPSFGTDHRHQSYPAQVSRQHTGLPAQQRTGQSFAGHETFSHRNTGPSYSDESSDAYFDDNHSTMSGMSREIVFESGPYGKGVVVLPVVVAEEARYSDGSDLERGQSRKINRAGLRMSKSVRHVTGAAGPKVPIAMPITMEDNTVPVPAEPLEDETEDDDGLQRRGTVNRAGLRMTNSVRHIVGADGPTSFSHTPAHQIPTRGSTDMSYTSGDYSGSTFSPEEGLRRDMPMAPKRMTEYDSNRPGQRYRSTRGYSSSKGDSIYQGHSGFHTAAGSVGQLSSREGYSNRQEPAPPREQPYFYASAPPAATAAELDKIRAQSFSASKMSIFEKQATAAPPASFSYQIHVASQPISPSTPAENVMLAWWEAQSLNGDHSQDKASDKAQNVTPKSQSKFKAQRTRSTARKEHQSQEVQTAFSDDSITGSKDSMDVDTPPKTFDYSFKTLESLQAQEVVTDKPVSNMKKHSAFRKELAASVKRRMEEAFESEGAKKRKLSNDKEDDKNSTADKIVSTASKHVAKEPANRTQPGAASVQKLKEKFSAPAPEKSALPAAINPFRQHRDDSPKAPREEHDMEEEPTTATNTSKGRDTVTGRSKKLAPPAAFSADGGRSRISTLSAQQAPSLPAVPEAIATDGDVGMHDTNEDVSVPSILRWKEKSVTISQHPEVEAHDTAMKAMALRGELPPDWERINLKDCYAMMPNIEQRHILPERLYKSAATRQYNSSGQVSVSKVVPKQTDRCLHCKGVVLKTGLREHQKQCFKEKTAELRRLQKDEMEAKTEEEEDEEAVDHFVKAKGEGGDEADKVSVHDLASAALKSRRMSERAKIFNADKHEAASAETSAPSREALTAVLGKSETSKRAGKVEARAWLVPARVEATFEREREREKAEARNQGRAGNEGDTEQSAVQQAKGELAKAGQGQEGATPVKRGRERPRKIRPEGPTAQAQHEHEHHGRRRGTVSMLAEKFEGSLGEPAISKTIISTRLTGGAPSPEKKVSDMGADGALSTTPPPVPKEELSRAFTMFLADKFQLDIADLGEITIEVGKEVPVAGPLARERKKMSFEAWRRNGDL